MRILIAEDDTMSRMILKAFLAPYGDIVECENGSDASKEVRAAHEEKAPFSLICLDIMMPKMNGQDTLKTIRILERSLRVREDDQAKIIMTTALSDKKNMAQAGHRKADAYLVKPVRKNELEEELGKLGFTPEQDLQK